MVSLINFYKPDIANWLKKESQVVGFMRTEPSVKTWSIRHWINMLLNCKISIMKRRNESRKIRALSN